MMKQDFSCFRRSFWSSLRTFLFSVPKTGAQHSSCWIWIQHEQQLKQLRQAWGKQKQNSCRRASLSSWFQMYIKLRLLTQIQQDKVSMREIEPHNLVLEMHIYIYQSRFLGSCINICLAFEKQLCFRIKVWHWWVYICLNDSNHQKLNLVI